MEELAKESRDVRLANNRLANKVIPKLQMKVNELNYKGYK